MEHGGWDLLGLWLDDAVREGGSTSALPSLLQVVKHYVP